MAKGNKAKGVRESEAAGKPATPERSSPGSSRAKVAPHLYNRTAFHDTHGLNQFHKDLGIDIVDGNLEDNKIRQLLTVAGQTLTSARLQLLVRGRIPKQAGKPVLFGGPKK